METALVRDKLVALGTQQHKGTRDDPHLNTQISASSVLPGMPVQENTLPSPSSPLMRMSILLNSFSASSTAAAMVWGCRTSMDRARHCCPVAATSFLEA